MSTGYSAKVQDYERRQRGIEQSPADAIEELNFRFRAGGLPPECLDRSFDQLIATLTSGLPKVRNEEGAHGQGAQPKKTPVYVAAYALHLAVAKIVFLVEALKASS